MGKAVVTIAGGIGNQLFQYAFAKLIEQKTGLSVYLYDITEQNYFGRTWQLDHFNISLPRMQSDEAHKLLRRRKIPPIIHRILSKLGKATPLHHITAQHLLLAELKPFVPLNDIYSSEHHRQGAGILTFVNQLNKDHSYWLQGYWQSWIVVDTIGTILKQELKFASDPHTKTIELLDQIKATPTPVAVHLRTNWRQVDGGSSVLSHVHNQRSLPIAYYRKAINYIRQQCHQPTFFIFTDDIQLAAKLLSELESKDDMIYTPYQDRPAWQDLLLMKHCRHFILSNSTFAWWGCWLASHSKRICIMPDNWLGYDMGKLISSRMEMGRDTIRL